MKDLIMTKWRKGDAEGITEYISELHDRIEYLELPFFTRLKKQIKRFLKRRGLW
jgi:hypothetical protein